MRKLPTVNEIIDENLGGLELTMDADMWHFYKDVIRQCIESHTAAHTAALRERVKELENELANAITNVSELMRDLSINQYTIEDMRKSFYAGHSLCDDEWRDKRKLVGFDEFIQNLK